MRTEMADTMKTIIRHVGPKKIIEADKPTVKDLLFSLAGDIVVDKLPIYSELGFENPKVFFNKTFGEYFDHEGNLNEDGFKKIKTMAADLL
jgi:hypothetical protein